ncbi:helix-turn-helix domain-containing protein [Paenibacillus sp. HB172176]|uniref:helix-turn-helix transcriptional regulator n=1 Tax=Paenibacillus sp. HB172176 TaxID=2493690 RepID=UPI00143C67AC|nr:helix-turn-helix domain-containing protein [Paenibacillus sp. HB172176]
MNKEQFIQIISEKMKLVRVERNYTQDHMAEVLGISKKTLVQIEKDRMLAGWTTAVALCALFRDSEIIQAAIGGDPLEVVETIAHDSLVRAKDKTMGGNVWWREEAKQGGFRLQQNVISKHFRILDEKDYRWFSSFDKEEAVKQLNLLAEKMQ